MTTMKVSPKGVLEIAEHEGIVLGPYFDSVGVLTDGVGHTAAGGGHDPAKRAKVDTRNWTDEQVLDEMLRAVNVFDADLDRYEARVNKAITVPLKQHEFDALVSFDFNTGGIHRAELTRAINRRDKDSSRHFFGWLRPPELRKRRTAEKSLFDTGRYDANGDTIPVYDALPSGKIKFRKAISGKELAKMMKIVPEAKHQVAVGKTNENWVLSLLRWLNSLKGK